MVPPAVCIENVIRFDSVMIFASVGGDDRLGPPVAALLRSKVSLEAENAALRHQIIVLRRKLRGRARLSNGDRVFFVWLYRLFPSIVRAILIIRPDTLVRWHRAGFRRYW